MAIPKVLQSQVRKLSYTVKRGGDPVGSTHFIIDESNNNLRISMQTKLQIKVLLTFDVFAKENCIFENGILTSSALQRVVNGSEKLNNSTTRSGTGYILKSKDKTKQMAGKAISFNVLKLYHSEPVGVRQIYTESFQKIVTLVKTGPHQYKFELPDGSTNEYFFSNGQCYKMVNSQMGSKTIFELKR